MYYTTQNPPTCVHVACSSHAGACTEVSLCAPALSFLGPLCPFCEGWRPRAKSGAYCTRSECVCCAYKGEIAAISLRCQSHAQANAYAISTLAGFSAQLVRSDRQHGRGVSMQYAWRKRKFETEQHAFKLKQKMQIVTRARASIMQSSRNVF